MSENVYQVTFSLSISSDDFLKYYKGLAKSVLVRGSDGRTVKFPANRLQKFLTHDGVYGEFVMRYDENHKLISIDRLNDGGHGSG